MENENKKKDLIFLSSKVLDNTSIEELEERLEFGRWGCSEEVSPCPPFGDEYGCRVEPEELSQQ